ncbi:MAG: hypothetical protein LW832_05385, partial [Parachlamydia sp.]|nr:hypothetical protein [Parachlamydia sp.]
MEFGRKYTTVFKAFWAFFAFFWMPAQAEPLFSFKEEGLFFQPLFTNDFIAAPSLDTENSFRLQPGGPGKKNKFNYSQGYRFNLSYTPSACWLEKISLSAAFLPASRRQTIDLASFLEALNEESLCVNTPGTFRSSHALSYYAGNLFAIFTVFNSPCYHLTWQAGLHYASINYQTDLLFSTSSLPFHPRIKESSKSHGIGPFLGVHLDYPLLSSLSFIGQIRGALLLSQASVHLQSKSCIRSPHSLTKFFPYWETKAGFAYAFELAHVCFQLEIGYEYISYPNFINRLQYPGTFDQDPSILFIPRADRSLNFSSASFASQLIARSCKLIQVCCDLRNVLGHKISPPK